MPKVTLPPWLMPYLEKELDDCWIFYKKGDDFTTDQYLELGNITKGFIRSPHTSFKHEWIGVQIKVYKGWGKVTTPEY